MSAVERDAASEAPRRAWYLRDPMDLRLLRYFLAVVDERGFRNAARALHVSQPPLSRAVRELETEIGAPLIDRTGSTVAPTRAGTLLAKRARKILADIERARTDVSRIARPRDVVRVAHVLPEYLLEPAAAQAIAALGRRRNGFALSVTPMLPPRAAAAIMRASIDVGFVFLPFEHGGAALRVEPLLHDDVVAALPIGHRLVTRGAVSLASLARETLVLFPRRAMPERHDEIVGMFRRAGRVPTLRTVGPSLRQALASVASAGGFSVVPRRASAVHSDLDVALRPIAEVATFWTLAAVLRESPSDPTRELVRALRRAQPRR
jgi:DNA-binding transcriptional LysR family regulator